MLKIVTDSTCDLPPAWLQENQITIVPIHIHFGLETFREGQTITPDIFYRRIETSGVLPTTSQPSVGELSQLYRELTADGSEVLSVHVTSKLSGTWQSAILAARQLPPNAPVSVIDSLNGSVGLGLLVREAVQLARSGCARAEIAARLEARRAHSHIFIMLRDLRFARMSGRIGRLRELLAAVLHVKPIVGVDAGALIPLERVRSQQKGFERMVELATERVGQTPIQVGIAHSLAPAEAETMLALVKSRLNCRDAFIADLALSLAVHFGPGTVGFAAYPAEDNV